MEPQIFEYKNIYEYLDALKKSCGGRRRPLTYNQLAQRLGYDSPRTVAMAWTGKRPLSKNLLSRLRVLAKLTPKQYVYLELLAEKEKKKSRNLEITQQLQELARLSKNYKKRSLPNRVFSLISNWEHAVLQQLLQGRRKISIPNLQKKIRGGLSVQAIEKAIENLHHLQLLAYNEKQGVFQESHENIVVGQDLPSKAIVSYHQQLLALASTALTEQLLSDRDFTGHTLRFSPERMQEARDFIYSFVQEFNDKFFESSEDEIYQLNIQFFSHTNAGVDLAEGT